VVIYVSALLVVALAMRRIPTPVAANPPSRNVVA
jgi:hypothetical protein